MSLIHNVIAFLTGGTIDAVTSITNPVAVTNANLDSPLSTLNTSVNSLLKPANTLAKVSTVDTITNKVSVNDGAGIKIFDTVSSTYKGLRFNAEAPQVCSQQYLYAVAEGDIAGHTNFAKFGRVTNVQNSTYDVMDTSTGTYVFSASAVKLDVTGAAADTAAGAGAQKIKINGLKADYSEQTEEVTMNGATIVTTVATFLRVNKVWVSAVGVNGVATGPILIKETGTGTVVGGINSGMTQSRQLIYTVPLGKTLYITSVKLSSGVGNTSASAKNNYTIFTTRAKVDPGSGAVSTIFYPFNEIGIVNGSFELNLESPIKIPATADLKISVMGDTALAVICTAAIRGWLE